MKACETVKENYLFRRIYKRGKSAVEPAMVVYCQKNRQGHTRLGVTASTKLGKAVVRNFARRRIREMWRHHLPEMVKGYDVIVVVRHKTVSLPFSAVEKQYLRALGQLELLQEESL